MIAKEQSNTKLVQKLKAQLGDMKGQCQLLIQKQLSDDRMEYLRKQITEMGGILATKSEQILNL